MSPNGHSKAVFIAKELHNICEGCTTCREDWSGSWMIKGFRVFLVTGEYLGDDIGQCPRSLAHKLSIEIHRFHRFKLMNWMLWCLSQFQLIAHSVERCLDFYGPLSTEKGGEGTSKRPQRGGIQWPESRASGQRGLDRKVGSVARGNADSPRISDT